MFMPFCFYVGFVLVMFRVCFVIVLFFVLFLVLLSVYEENEFLCNAGVSLSYGG